MRSPRPSGVTSLDGEAEAGELPAEQPRERELPHRGLGEPRHLGVEVDGVAVDLDRRVGIDRRLARGLPGLVRAAGLECLRELAREIEIAGAVAGRLGVRDVLGEDAMACLIEI